jgi:hypothetical protein
VILSYGNACGEDGGRKIYLTCKGTGSPTVVLVSGAGGASDEWMYVALWDGNEVWLVVAGAAMFAAFPGWYATLFSGFYLAIVLLLAALIVRGVSFEYRGKSPAERWRRTWSWLLIAGSLIAPLVIGIALGDLLHGLPIAANHEYTGSFWDLFQPYGIYVGVTLVVLCALHGATFIALKTTGDVSDRARKLAARKIPTSSTTRSPPTCAWPGPTLTTTSFPRRPNEPACCRGSRHCRTACRPVSALTGPPCPVVSGSGWP